MAWSTLSKNIRHVPAHFPGDRMDGNIASSASIAFYDCLPTEVSKVSHAMLHTCVISTTWS